jgi:hypothetical protein
VRREVRKDRASGRGWCPSGKRRFRDHESAQRAVRDISARSHRARVPVRSYECALCKGWHLTSAAV